MSPPNFDPESLHPLSRRTFLTVAGVLAAASAVAMDLTMNVTPASAADGFRQPLDEPFEYRDRFGMRWNPVTGIYELHAGQDYGKWNGRSWSGAPIRSIGAGRISAKGSGDARGNYVHVRHPDGHTSVYMHMLGPSPLGVGDPVSAGTVIGAIGNTGRSTGAHLHLEVRTVNWTAIDPIAFINNNPQREEDEMTPEQAALLNQIASDVQWIKARIGGSMSSPNLASELGWVRERIGGSTTGGNLAGHIDWMRERIGGSVSSPSISDQLRSLQSA